MDHLFLSSREFQLARNHSPQAQLDEPEQSYQMAGRPEMVPSRPSHVHPRFVNLEPNTICLVQNVQASTRRETLV
jgi:hypothetical protein